MRSRFINLITVFVICCVLVPLGVLYGAQVSSTPTGYVFTRNLRLGASGIDVQELQQYLNTHGFTVASTGPGSPGKETTRFGSATLRALARFQADKHIDPAVGFLGPITRAYINGTTGPACSADPAINTLSQTELARGMNRAEVKTLQQYLNQHGYIIAGLNPGAPGRETTYFGPGTQYAVMRFQIDMQVPQTGAFDAATRAAFKGKACASTAVSTPEKLVTKTNKPEYYSGSRTPSVITLSQIPLTAPVAGNTPSSSIDTAQYSGTVVWSGNPAVFSPRVSYTATITIAPKDPYGMVGLPANFFTVSDATSVSYAQNSDTVVVAFPATGTTALSITDPTLTLSKAYDGTTSAAVTPGTLSGVIGSDEVTVTATATYDSAAVGTGKTITVAYSLSGAQAAHYIAPTDYVVSTGEITLAGAVAAPTFSPAAGKIPLTLQRDGDSTPVGTAVTITSTTPGAAIYYTTDGSTPTTASALYTDPLLINADTTVKVLATHEGYTDTTSSATYAINQNTQYGSWTHGSTQIGDVMFGGTWTTPTTVTRYNNPSDLSDAQSVNLTGRNSMSDLVYDPVHNKLYGSTYNSGSQALTILQIDPTNLASWSVVYSSSVPKAGFPSPIVTDGTYVYAATYAFGANDNHFLKIQISNWTLVGDTAWTGRKGSHTTTLISYADRKELYVTNNTYYLSPQISSHFAKVNTNTMTYSEIQLNVANGFIATDDMACVKENEAGATCYVVPDRASTILTGYKVDTATMTATPFSINNEISYGTFVYNNDLYVLDVNNRIIIYRNRDVTAPEIYNIPNGIIPNELFYSSDGRLIVTDWNTAPRVTEIKLAP